MQIVASTFQRLITRMAAAVVVVGVLPCASWAQAPTDPVAAIVATLERAVREGNADALGALLSPSADQAEIAEFSASWFRPGATRAVLRERDRAPLDGVGRRVVAEILVETGASARLATWQVDLRLGSATPFVVSSLRTLGVIDGLHRLTLNPARQFHARNLRIGAEDVELRVPNGAVFVAEAGSGITAAVVVGRGEMVFSPAPEGERGQVRLFAGDEVLRSSFDGALVRMNPADFESVLDPAGLQPAAVDARALRAAETIFRTEVAKSFSVDLGDLSSELWSLVPTPGDVLMDVRTRRFGTLTYARAGNEPEDITVFDRARRRNISIYSSTSRLAARGPSFHEDDDADYDVLDYAIETSFAPDRLVFDGRTRIRLRIKAHALSSLTLRLASGLAVRSVSSSTGRLLFLRVRNQDSLVVNLPAVVTRDAEMVLTIAYAGRLEPQGVEGEMAMVGQVQYRDESPIVEPEPSYVYSSRNYWYPQGPVSDYATATVRLTVPAPFAAVCSGEAAAGSPVSMRDAEGRPTLLHLFVARQPVRYVGCAVSRLVPGESRVVPVPAADDHATNGPPPPRELTLSVFTTARQRARGRELLVRAEEIAAFYARLMREVPYPTFTLAVVESHVPGGHSPAFFAALNQPLPTSPFTWRDDPAAFDNYPEFFLAHELAHQWWGHGVGWQNYHEQWLSEAFAQYFAALYAHERRGPEVFEGILRSMNRWAVDYSDQGAVHLGYRLGHIKNNSRIMRAIVYNKGALVLHMARGLVGDDVFFRVLRRFYKTHRFRKTGTEELQQAFEAEAGRSFSRFFDRWIHGTELPTLSHQWRVEGTGADQAVVLRFEQGETVFDFAVTVTLQFADGTTRKSVVPITERVVEHRLPAPGRVRTVLVNEDKGALTR